MKKNVFTRVLLTLTFAFSLLSFPASAAAEKLDELPTTSGQYSVSGQSKLKLRVHVYNARNDAKRTGSGSPSQQLTCNLPDSDSSTVDGLIGWHLPSGTWTYRLNPASAPSQIGGSKMAVLVDRAFSAWRATDVGKSVNFRKGSNSARTRAQYDGQNLISWGSASASALAVTYTWYNTSTGVVAENDTIFNNRFAWNWADQSTNPGCAYQNYYDAQDILTHELGHWTGLNDNYAVEFTDNTMFGYGSPTEIKKDTISSGDLIAVNTIY